MIRFPFTVALLIFFWGGTFHIHAQTSGEMALMQALHARDNSIESFKLKIRKKVVILTPIQFQEFANTLDSAKTENDAIVIEDRLVKSLNQLCGKDSIISSQTMVLSRGNKFSAETVYESKNTKNKHKENFNGELFRSFTQANSWLQLNIYSADSNLKASVPSLEQFNITTKQLLSFPVIKIENTNSNEYLFKISEKQNTRVVFDANLRIQHLVSEIEGKLYLQKYFLDYQMVDQYPVPKVMVEYTHDDNAEYLLKLVFIDEVEFNPIIKDSDLELDVPPWAVVVDRRRDPPIITRQMLSPEKIQKDAEEESLEHIADVSSTQQLKQDSKSSITRPNVDQPATPLFTSAQQNGQYKSGNIIWYIAISCILIVSFGIFAAIKFNKKKT